MPDYSRMSRDNLLVEIQVLNEELLEAEELVDGLNMQIENLQVRNRLLETLLCNYGIAYNDIDEFLM